MLSNAFALAESASCKCCTAGISLSFTAVAAAIYIAVGKVSLDDCDIFTWSFGCTGFLLPISPPAISIARFEITSFTFIFV